MHSSFPDGDLLLLVFEFASAPLVASLVCRRWKQLLEDQLKRLPFEIVQATVDGIVAMLEVTEHVKLLSQRRIEEMDAELDAEEGNAPAAVGAGPSASGAGPSASVDSACDLSAADFLLSTTRLRPVPVLTRTTLETLKRLSPTDPDDEQPAELTLELRAAWSTVLKRPVPASWRFHCLDDEPMAGDFGDNPYELFVGVQLQECHGGSDFTLSMGQFDLMMLQNGIEYYYRLGEEEEEEMWENEHGEEAPKGSTGAHWCCGGPWERGRFQGCREIHVAVRGQQILWVEADRILHGPVVPPFQVQVMVVVDEMTRRMKRGPQHMWLPWADCDEWRAWEADDEARMPILPESWPPLLTAYPLESGWSPTIPHGGLGPWRQ